MPVMGRSETVALSFHRCRQRGGRKRRSPLIPVPERLSGSFISFSSRVHHKAVAGHNGQRPACVLFFPGRDTGARSGTVRRNASAHRGLSVFLSLPAGVASARRKNRKKSLEAPARKTGKRSLLSGGLLLSYAFSHRKAGAKQTGVSGLFRCRALPDGSARDATNGVALDRMLQSRLTALRQRGHRPAAGDGRLPPEEAVRQAFLK